VAVHKDGLQTIIRTCTLILTTLGSPKEGSGGWYSDRDTQGLSILLHIVTDRCSILTLHNFALQKIIEVKLGSHFAKKHAS